jgi:hypothetical protein
MESFIVLAAQSLGTWSWEDSKAEIKRLIKFLYRSPEVIQCWQEGRTPDCWDPLVATWLSSPVGADMLGRSSSSWASITAVANNLRNDPVAAFPPKMTVSSWYSGKVVFLNLYAAGCKTRKVFHTSLVAVTIHSWLFQPKPLAPLHAMNASYCFLNV